MSEDRIKMRPCKWWVVLDFVFRYFRILENVCCEPTRVPQWDIFFQELQSNVTPLQPWIEFCTVFCLWFSESHETQVTLKKTQNVSIRNKIKKYLYASIFSIYLIDLRSQVIETYFFSLLTTLWGPQARATRLWTSRDNVNGVREVHAGDEW